VKVSCTVLKSSLRGDSHSDFNNYLQVLLKKQGKSIEVVNLATEETEDLMTDFISIITSFCTKIYGLRRSKRKTENIIKELNNEAS
jgi:predicted site-specific integrase-resolvase